MCVISLIVFTDKKIINILQVVVPTQSDLCRPWSCKKSKTNTVFKLCSSLLEPLKLIANTNTNIRQTFQTRGRFHKSWARGANHRDSSIKVGRMAESALYAFKKRPKTWAYGAKQFMKSTPDPNVCSQSNSRDRYQYWLMLTR